MTHTSLTQIVEQLSLARSHPAIHFSEISTDTRTLQPHNLFVALRGKNFDGHEFVSTAYQKNATAALVEHFVDCPIPQYQVTDTTLALGQMAREWRNQFNLPLIGVTGSNGKTTVKNMLASILQAMCQGNKNAVLATEGNLNNHIGLPLMLTRLSNSHRYAVLEMGMNHFGEIKYLTELAKPTVAVITNAASAHLEGVGGTVAGVAKAKGEIFLGLSPHGIAVLNRDDAYFEYWQTLIGQRKYLSFGLHATADVTAKQIHHQTFILMTPAGEATIQLNFLGKHNILNALAAAAAAIAIDLPLTAIKTGLENTHPAPGRMRPYYLENNIHIIDDTYNANPFSLEAAVNVLATFSGKKILILGDMKELGVNAEKIHAEVGEKIRLAGIHYLFTLGQLSKATTQRFGKNAEHFTEREKLMAAIQPHLTQDTTILIKGSRSMQMEKILAALIPVNITP